MTPTPRPVTSFAIYMQLLLRFMLGFVSLLVRFAAACINLVASCPKPLAAYLCRTRNVLSTCRGLQIDWRDVPGRAMQLSVGQLSWTAKSSSSWLQLTVAYTGSFKTQQAKEDDKHGTQLGKTCLC